MLDQGRFGAAFKMGDSRRDAHKATTRRIRRSYERHARKYERITLIYDTIRRIIDEGRVTESDALEVIEMICRDYDDEVENLSISWAQVHRAWRGNRDDSDD